MFENRTSTLLPDGSVPGRAAWGDYDGDGWVDLAAGSKVYRNLAGTSFAATGASIIDALWGDFNNDGFLDIFSYYN